MTNDKSRGPAVAFPPPLLFVGGLLVAWLLESRVRALPFLPDAVSPIAYRAAGYVVVAIGIGVMFWGAATFARAKTAIIPNKPASSLVETGPYRFTRNPMYTGMTITYLGIAILLNSGWALLLLPVVLKLLHSFVIKREENYLLSEFGDSYDAYRARVKRWV